MEPGLGPLQKMGHMGEATLTLIVPSQNAPPPTGCVQGGDKAPRRANDKVSVGSPHLFV